MRTHKWNHGHGKGEDFRYLLKKREQDSMLWHDCRFVTTTAICVFHLHSRGVKPDEVDEARTITNQLMKTIVFFLMFLTIVDLCRRAFCLGLFLFRTWNDIHIPCEVAVLKSLLQVTTTVVVAPFGYTQFCSR